MFSSSILISLSKTSLVNQDKKSKFIAMERLLSHAAKGACPFLTKTTPTQLRALSTSSSLLTRARECPVFSKALHVSSARLSRPISSSSKVPQKATVALKQECVVEQVGQQVFREEKREKGFDYEAFIEGELDKKHSDKSYRYFNNINRLAREFPLAHTASREARVTVWCSNDYLGMSKHPLVVEAMK